MKRAILLLIGIAGIVPLLAQERGGEDAKRADSGAFTLGVLRRDGMVLPFAAYDGRQWQAPWPADPRYAELPISLDSIDRVCWVVDWSEL
jgi:hypothetical protein